jgi:hypothetical protein
MTDRIFLYPYAGPGGRNYIKQLGTKQDIEKLNISLKEGLKLAFYCDDADDNGNPDNLYFDGTVYFDSETKSWYVVIDEDSYRHASSESQRR